MENKRWLYKPNPAYQQALINFIPTVEELAERYPGVQVENKTHTLAVHFRNIENPVQILSFVMELTDLLTTLNEKSDVSFRLKLGSNVLEFAPAYHDKGKGIAFLQKHLDIKGKHISFFGDDLTDEDGFKVVNELGGTSVRVGEQQPGITTVAQHKLLNTGNVFDVIRRILG